MSEPNFQAIGDEANDDLPMAFRREKEARAREARERAAQERAAAGPSLSMGSPSIRPDVARPDVTRHELTRHDVARADIRPDARPDTRSDAKAAPAPQLGPAADVRPANASLADVGMPATVKRFDVPFGHLVQFFLKCVIAAIPAMILLGVVLWVLGAALTVVFPSLLKLKILIGFGA